MFNLKADARHVIAKILSTKGKMVSHYPRYLITSEETFEVLRESKQYSVSYTESGMPIPTVCGLKVIVDNELVLGEVEVR